jgi:curved DNA-binding protein CbpA
MKIGAILILLACFASLVYGWSKEDYEIFSINDKVKADLGENVTFYSWLNIAKGRKASYQEISKAYKKISRQLHPDKFVGVSKAEKKKAEERFQRLSVVGNILKDASLKERYDYFLDKGFPKWKGTGYYYSKYRPGLIGTLVFLYVLVSSLHFVALTISRGQDYKRLVSLKDQIKSNAWSGSVIPPADGSDRKVSNEANGKVFIVKPDGSVWLESDEELIELNENHINTSPGFKDSLIFRGPCFIWNKSIGKWTGKTIDTTVVYETNNKPINQVNTSRKSSNKKKVQKGKKIELPNGKVVYSRKTR